MGWCREKGGVQRILGEKGMPGTGITLKATKINDAKQRWRIREGNLSLFWVGEKATNNTGNKNNI